ncbi:helix-turn-helix transcriptional regulator [Phenylobacterium sp.]|uniref:S24 family peptidase n=1 Tax=Phenylobacterium sp. TaxID=1871053 RepID=UPI00391ACA4A
MFAAMTDILTWSEVARRLEGMGRGARSQLAKRLGLDPSDLSRRLKRAGEPTASQVRKIEEFLEGMAPAEIAALPPGAIRLPVFGYAAAGGEDRVALASGQVLDHVEIPPGLVRGDAMIVRVVGESMYPRLRSGESVLAERGVPPVRYEDVLVEMADGTGLVKEYRGQRDGYLFLYQYNPEKEVRVPLTQVRALHAAWPWRRR